MLEENIYLEAEEESRKSAVQIKTPTAQQAGRASFIQEPYQQSKW
jgi:hypothetical protein